MLILALALAAAQPTSALETAAPAAEPARAVRWLQNYAHVGDYPREAVGLRQQGRVFYEMTIGPNGRAVSCRTLVSSGAPSLDATTCRIMQSRARFIPARDAAGQPTVDRIRHSIEWILPGE